MRPLFVVVTALLGCGPAAALDPVADFGADPGDLLMFEHVPAGVVGPMPVVLVLHGCSQDRGYADDAGLVAFADELGFGLVVAEQRGANNSQRCFNWFETGDIEAQQGEAGSLASMIQSFKGRHDVDDDRVFVTGLSSGGAMTAVLLVVEPGIFAAGASFAGLPYRCGTGLVDAFSCMNTAQTRTQAAWTALVTDNVDVVATWPRLLIVQGDADGTVNSKNSENLALQFSGLHGLPAAPTSSFSGDGRTTSLWQRGGETLVSRVVVDDMGHGLPIDPPACGTQRSFLLDENFCGTLAALQFFGIAEGEGEGEGEGEPAGEGEKEPVGEGEGEPAAEGEGEDVVDEGGCGGCSSSSSAAGLLSLVLLLQRRRKRVISSVT